MTPKAARTLSILLVACSFLFGSARVPAQDDPRAAAATPPRLSLADGEVSFWRPGADDWTPARLNTALAAGDQLYTGPGANLELQVGAHAYVRAAEATQLGLENLEPDFVQFKITAGHAALDLRELPRGHGVELDTPNAAFSIEQAGYYRVDVGDDTTTFIARRGGRAMVTPAGGQATAVADGDQMVVQGTDTAQVASYPAPKIDEWDRWNYDRTDHRLAAAHTDYAPAEMYGSESLDEYGTWRTVPTYGRVWAPSGVAPDWAPYSTGRWTWDPSYDWTWVDDAPWGWAPYHYGRWVYADNYWAWAPGPLVAPVYAPALVAFFGGSGFHVGIGFGVPAVSWCALGWGEPVIPWWGGVGFAGRPWWGGWGGPRVVNNVIVNNTTIVNGNNINIYRNAGLRHAVVSERQDQFGRGNLARLTSIDVHRLRPLHGSLPVTPSPASLVPASGQARRPSDAALARRVVATRAPHDPSPSLRAAGLNAASPPARTQLVPATHPQGRDPSAGRLRMAERQRPPTAAMAPGRPAPQHGAGTASAALHGVAPMPPPLPSDRGLRRPQFAQPPMADRFHPSLPSHSRAGRTSPPPLPSDRGLRRPQSAQPPMAERTHPLVPSPLRAGRTSPPPPPRYSSNVATRWPQAEPPRRPQPSVGNMPRGDAAPQVRSIPAPPARALAVPGYVAPRRQEQPAAPRVNERFVRPAPQHVAPQRALPERGAQAYYRPSVPPSYQGQRQAWAPRATNAAPAALRQDFGGAVPSGRGRRR